MLFHRSLYVLLFLFFQSCVMKTFPFFIYNLGKPIPAHSGLPSRVADLQTSIKLPAVFILIVLYSELLLLICF